jgi:Rod binding domain-containing protein
MSSTGPSALPVDMLRPVSAAPALTKGMTPDKIAKTARDFEASFIGAMLQPMFDTLSTAPPFGGGQGEQAFKSFMVNAVAQQVAKKGGIGLSASIQREMLKMQGAS